MATQKIVYATSATIAITSLNSLATSSNRTAGASSVAVDNTSNKYVDAELSGKIKAGTTPTVNKQIDVWLYASDGNDVYPDTLDGTDSAKTITSENVRNSAMKLLTSIRLDSTTDRIYYLRCESVAAVFGGPMPPKWGVFIVHDGVAALNASGHELRYIGIHYELV
jgi:hypothetical protein